MAHQHPLSKRLLSGARAGALLVLFLTGGLSCGLFETRKPNDPGQNTFPCAPLTAQSDVFANIEQAYGRGDGLPCYLSSLSDSIVFDFDDADSNSSPPDTYLLYKKSVEQVVAQNIASAGGDSLFLQLKAPYTLIRNDPDAQTRRYAYEIKFKGTIPDTLFQGLAEITVRKNAGGQWQASEWIDRPDPAGTTSRTWGYLRGQHRIGI